MSYTPTAEKLASIGFKRANTEGYLFEQTTQVAEKLERWCTITQRKDGRVALYEHFFASGPVEEPRPSTVYCAALPSEEFFDTLLQAVGWLDSCPPAKSDRPAVWDPVYPGQSGVFLTTNGKYQVFADPINEWKIAKYGLRGWLANIPSSSTL